MKTKTSISLEKFQFRSNIIFETQHLCNYSNFVLGSSKFSYYYKYLKYQYYKLSLAAEVIIYFGLKIKFLYFN